MEKVDKFEKAFVRGVMMHTETLWCVNECKRVSRIMFDAQMVLSIVTLVSLFPVLLGPNRDMWAFLANVPTGVICLIATGYFMWNAGDIAVEASNLPDAMYGSGWENCAGTNTHRIRKLIVVAMAQAKQPVIMKALGFIELSYNTYVGILKTLHSVFSVFY